MTTATIARERHLITPAALADALASTSPPTLLDVRFVPLEPGRREDYEREHIPGALFVDLPLELAGKSGPGAYPLPDLAALQEVVRSWGVDTSSEIVVYDDFFGGGSARAWWTLHWAGLTKVRVLDGGLAAWRAAGVL